MKAVSCLQGALSVVELPAPRPAPGQLVVDVKRSGICGTDLHARLHCDDLADVMAENGYQDSMRSDTPVVMGHEFCGEIVERGRRVAKRFKIGANVVSMPLVRAYGGVHLTGFSPQIPGGYAEQSVDRSRRQFPRPQRAATRSRGLERADVGGAARGAPQRGR